MAGESAREVARRARDKAARLQHRADMFERGAEGEERTAQVLAGMPSDWTAIHDVRWPGRRLANVDHVALGPGGIFVIDSKHWSGRVSIHKGTLRQNGRSREKSVASAADAALAVAALVGPHAMHVHAVLCFVGQEETLTGWSRDVMICSADNLIRMLESRPALLSTADSMDAWFRLDAQLRSASSSSSRTGHSNSGTKATTRGSRHAVRMTSTTRCRRKSGSSLLRLLVGAAMLIGLMTVGPQMASGVGALVSEYLTKGTSPPPCASPETARSDGEGAERDRGKKRVRRANRDREATTRHQQVADSGKSC